VDDEGENAFSKSVEVGEVGRGHVLALQDGKPPSTWFIHQQCTGVKCI
jgi:hypothetical protein